MNTPISELQTKGLVAISYPKDLRAAVQRTVESWKKFCALPNEVKDKFLFSKVDIVGYERKDGVGPGADKKENFELTLAGSARMLQIGETVANPIAEEFLRNVIGLVGLIKPTVLDFAEQSEAAFDMKGFAKEVEEGEDLFFVRFIHYFGDREPGEETATAHADQSGFTLHLFESAPGLQCLPYESDWADMPVSEGETVIIPAMQMQLRSKGKLRALFHRVVATSETARDGRYSAVCFVRLKNTPVYDKDTHGRLQEKAPGFNYKLSHEEFAKLFKK